MIDSPDKDSTKSVANTSTIKTISVWENHTRKILQNVVDEGDKATRVELWRGDADTICIVSTAAATHGYIRGQTYGVLKENGGI